MFLEGKSWKHSKRSSESSSARPCVASRALGGLAAEQSVLDLMLLADTPVFRGRGRCGTASGVDVRPKNGSSPSIHGRRTMFSHSFNAHSVMEPSTTPAIRLGSCF